MHRKDFIKSVSLATTGIALNPGTLISKSNHESISPPICIFTKCLQFLPYEPLGETIAGTGFDGADITVRKGGHVEPGNVKSDLPKAVKALHSRGLKVPMIVTDIQGADYTYLDEVLGTASNLGIAHYRMGYFDYKPSKSFQANLDDFKRKFEDLEKINSKYGIHGEYQNHTGTKFGGPVWDLYWVLKDFDPAYIGSQYDIHHATIEGGNSWSLGMKAMSPWIKTIVIKDFLWKKRENRWRVEDTPLGEGMVDFDAYFKIYKKLNIRVPVSIHYEYNLGGAESGKTETNMPLKDILFFVKKDLNWLREKFSQYQLN